MSKRFSYYGSFASVFNPLNVTGLEVYVNRNNATASSWLDQSTNAFDFVQGTVTKQPIVSANSVDFDGVDDVLTKSGTNLITDNTGIIFFSGYYNNRTLTVPIYHEYDSIIFSKEHIPCPQD